MADYDSSLPVRTRANSDVVVGIADQTTLTNTLAIDSNGRIGVTIRDATTDANTVAVDSSGRLSVKTATAGDIVAKIVDTGGTNELSVDASGRITTKLYSGDGSSWNMGQQTMANSMPVAIASDQSTINVNVVSTSPANKIHDYNTATAVAAGSSDTHTYTNSTGSTIHLEKVFASASGAMKIEVKTGTAGSETTKAVAFTTSAMPYVEINFPSEIDVANGDNILVVRTNRDKAAMDVYSFINAWY
ncbi:MAG: hypothetical protein ACTSX6_00280 [Candidatus Heimdallarchaeaceae archaeon]